MQKIILLTIAIFACHMGFAQNTYYWVGANMNANATLTGTDWNTQQNGSGTARSVANDNDILIIDGANLEFNFSAAANVKLKRVEVLNNASVAFINGATGVVTVTLAGDNDTKSLLVSGSSTFIIRSKTNSFLNFNLTKGGDVNNSTVRITGDDLGNGSFGAVRFGLSSTADKLIFTNGSMAYAESAATAFGGNTADNEKSVVFETGTTLYFVRGNSPFGTTNGNVPLLDFKKGSNLVVQGVSTNGNFFNNRSFGNLMIENGITYEATASNTFASVDNLTVRGNSTLKLPPNVTAFTSKVTGNINVEPGSELLVTPNTSGQTAIEMAGDGTLQTISGNITNLNMFKVASGANVKLNTNLVFGANRDNTIAGTFDVGNATLSGIGRVLTTAGATLITSHADGLKANIATTGNITLAEGTNYVFQTATLTPFPDNGAVTLNPANDVTFYGQSSINKDLKIGGTLTFDNVKLTLGKVRLTMLPGAIIAGTRNANSYMVAENIGCACSSGTLEMQGVTTTKIMPIGTSNYYTPVTVEASVASNLQANVFEGVTEDATPSGISIADKTNLVNATWHVSRIVGNGTFNVLVNWPDALEGIGFSTLANNKIGIARLNGISYDNFRGTGNNAQNTVKINNLTQNGPIIVGGIGTTLPISLLAFTTKRLGNSASLQWSTAFERNSSHFNIERSADGIKFDVIGTKQAAVNSTNQLDYHFADFKPLPGTNYYRITLFDIDNYSLAYEPQTVTFNDFETGLTVLMSTNSQQVKFNVATNNSGAAQVQLYNVQGKKVLEQAITVARGGNAFTLDTPYLPSGIYALQYRLGNEVYRAKVLK